MDNLISNELINKTKSWLKEDGIKFFRNLEKDYGRIDAIWMEGKIPHIVHFREGMQVRNFMRSTGLCDDWNAHDFDNNWVSLIEKCIR